MKTNKKEVKKGAVSKELYYSLSKESEDEESDIIEYIAYNTFLDTKEDCLSESSAGDIVYKVTINVEKLGVAKIVIGNE